MAKRDLKSRLAELARLRSAPLDDEWVAALRGSLADRSNHLVAKAAFIAAERGASVLTADLERAFERFMVDPVKTDKGCLAKSRLADALDRLDAVAEGVFLAGVRHVQLEPVFGDPPMADTAVPLRVRSAHALVRMRHPSATNEAVRLLADGAADARAGACGALAGSGRAEARLLLRFKALSGDPEPHVVVACFDALLEVEGGAAVEFVAEFLAPGRPAFVVEAAALSLGAARDEAAITPLVDLARRTTDRDLQRSAVAALAMLRRQSAIDAALSLIADGGQGLAVVAVTALAEHAPDERVEEQVRAAAATRGDAEVLRAVDHCYRPR